MIEILDHVIVPALARTADSSDMASAQDSDPSSSPRAQLDTSFECLGIPPLPVELYARILRFAAAISQPGLLCRAALVNQTFRTICERILYSTPGISAIPTLLARPELGTLAKSTVVTWDSDRAADARPENSCLHSGEANRSIVLTDYQAARYRFDDDLRTALSEGSIPAQTTLLIRLCPKLETFVGAIGHSEEFLDAIFPKISNAFTTPPASLWSITDIQLSPAPNWRSYNPQQIFDSQVVLRIMALPNLLRLRVYGVAEVEPWLDAVAIRAHLPRLAGTSAVRALDLAGFLQTESLRDLVQIPKALVAFSYHHHSPMGALDVADLADALVESPSRHTLQRVALRNADKAYTPSDGETTPVGDIRALAQLPALTDLETEAQFVVQRIDDEASIEQLIQILPKVQDIELARYLDVFGKDYALAEAAAARIIEELGKREKYCHLVIGLRDKIHDWSKVVRGKLFTLGIQHKMLVE
jgi:hypothetical protein